MRFVNYCLPLVVLTSTVIATSAVHDKSFTPHLNVRISEQVIQQSCLPAKPTVLINGTSPGPVIRLKTGRTYWIRVYNDMHDKNATMVQFSNSPRSHANSIPALAWSFHGYLSLQRW